MVLNIYAADKTQGGNGEKLGQGADGRSASFDWQYSREGLIPVK